MESKKSYKIYLIEDNTNLSENILEILEIQGYQVIGSSDNAEEVASKEKLEQVDLFLIDIRLKGKKSGIELAEEIRKNYKSPIVFITSSSGTEIIQKVKHLNPDGYIIKPFTTESLITIVELAIENYKFKQKKDQNFIKTNLIKDEIYIRENGWLKKLYIKDILWLKADGTYTHITCNDKKFTLRLTVKQFIEKLENPNFIRVHKSYIVNLKKIEAFNSNNIIIKGEEIPIGKTYYKGLISALNTVNN